MKSYRCTQRVFFFFSRKITLWCDIGQFSSRPKGHLRFFPLLPHSSRHVCCSENASVLSVLRWICMNVTCIGVPDFHLSHYHKWFIAGCVCGRGWGGRGDYLKLAHIISEPSRSRPHRGAILLVLFQFRPPPEGWRGKKRLSIFILPPDLFWVVIKARFHVRIFP